MSDFENQDYTAEDYAGMSDEQFELFKSYGVEMPEGIDALRAPTPAVGGTDEPPASPVGADGNPPVIPDTPDDDSEDDADDDDEPGEDEPGETPPSPAGTPPLAGEAGGLPSAPTDGENAAPDDASGTGDVDDYAKLQKKERNGELTKREARKLEAIRRQTNEQTERRQLGEKIAELERRLAEAGANEAKRTNELLEKYFGQAGLLGDGANDGAVAPAARHSNDVARERDRTAGGLPSAPTDGGVAPNGAFPVPAGTSNDAIALARIASLEQRLQARENAVSEQLMQREREKDVEVLRKIAPGIKTLQDVLNLDKFQEIVKVMQAQIAAGMPRDINKAYTLVYQDEIVEREVARRIQFQDKVDKADKQSNAPNVNHIKKLPTPAAREAVITPEMRATAKQYGFVTDDEVREIYKDQLLK
ncbi:MAG: hypothetical protein LBK23_11755 [Oscillospiraceae bacterium]|jgi:hypothetical protein|nr:hypothetical protein [Oscillospiraceae bacterium]